MELPFTPIGDNDKHFMLTAEKTDTYVAPNGGISPDPVHTAFFHKPRASV